MSGVRVPLGLPLKVRVMSKIISFIKSSRAELDKVIFPTKVQVKQAFIAVIIVVAVIAAYLALVDLLMSAIVSNFLKG